MENNLNGKIIALVQKNSLEVEEKEEVAMFFAEYFLKNSKEKLFPIKDMTRNFKKLIESIGVQKLIYYINILETNFTPQMSLFEKFLEILSINKEIDYFSGENSKIEIPQAKFLLPQQNPQNNNNSLENSRFFSSYSKEEKTFSYSPEFNNALGEPFEINSESKPFLLNIFNKNLSSF